jgi:DNA-binding transcriptional regulator PaaX
MKRRANSKKVSSGHDRGELVRVILQRAFCGSTSAGSGVSREDIFDFLAPIDRSARQKIWSALYYLQKHGDVILQETIQNTAQVTLTERGHDRLKRDAIWDLQLNETYAWDRKWRIVMFDVPAYASNRHEFRSKLQDLGFVQYQRSVFIYPHECRDEVMRIAEWFELDEYVRYIVASEIHDALRYVKIFDLQ